MGNGASCVSAKPAVAKLVEPDGTVRLVETPTGVAEIMMEFPGHVVARAEEVARTRRTAALPADEELQPGLVYVLLPMGRVGSRLSDQQMAALLEAIKARQRRRGKGRVEICGGRKRVFPEVAGGAQGKSGELGGDMTGFPCKVVGGCQQWRPALDIIHESN